MKRVVLFRNGSEIDGKVVLVTHSLEELLMSASQKLGIRASTLYTPQGGLLDDIRLIRDDDILYVSEGEDFINPSSSSNGPKSRPVGHVGTSSVAPAAVSNDWVTINVGGRLFATTRATLTTKEPNSMLAKMFSHEFSNLHPSCRDANGAYLIDRSYSYFEPLINYLRCGKLIIDPGINPEGPHDVGRFTGVFACILHLHTLS
ncbi:unnamed protein product, partial [Meganyctiphanes norvegica]